MCSKSSTVVEQCPGIVVGVETGEIGPPWGTAVATLLQHGISPDSDVRRPNGCQWLTRELAARRP